MRTIETNGKTVEEAIRAGLKALECDISEVTHEVIDAGSPGLFGMFGRLARVRLTVKDADPDFNFDMPALTLQAEPEKKASKKEKSQPKPAREKQPEAPAPIEAEEEMAPPKPKRAEKPRRERAPRRESPAPEAISIIDTQAEAEEAPVQPKPELPPLDVSALSEDGKKAYEFLKTVTHMMGVDVEIRMLEMENQITVELTGDTLGVLIGRRGETMDALQYLASLTVNKDKSGYTRVSLDVEHYRAKREETLRKLALRMANRAKKTGRRVVLEPMNPYERRVLHSALQSNPYVQTHSEGEEPYRRVIITLK